MATDTHNTKDATEKATETPPTVELETLSPNGEVDGREESAHVENMAVIPVFDDYGIVYEDDPKYDVASGSGSEYSVSPYGEGTCPDSMFNNPENGCKHIQRVIAELNRGRVPVPGEPVDEWMETEVFSRIKRAAEHLANLKSAQQAASEADDAKYDESDYDDPIETTAAILAGLRDGYEGYRERVNPDAPELPAIARSSDEE